MYQAGMGVPQDDAEAVKWYSKAAEQGDANAQYNLGLMYNSGKGIPRDDAESMKLWRKAAGQGLAAAQSILDKNTHGNKYKSDLK
jgi:TPR repeat protein